MRELITEKFLRAVRKLKTRFTSMGLILVYHRVAEADNDPWSLCVTPRNFREHLETLRKETFPLSLQKLVGNMRQGKVEKRSIALTFDDGYADNLYQAKPLLEKYDIPATLFLATGYIDQKQEYWWDELERLLLQPGDLPKELSLIINGKYNQWKLGKSAHYDADSYTSNRNWKAWEDAPSIRHSLYFSIWQLLQPLPEVEIRKVIDNLMTLAGIQNEARPSHRIISFHELVELAQDSLIEIGSHTVTHSALSSLSITSQREEIVRSKSYLDEVLNLPAVSFAYPFGRRCDYTGKTIELVKEAGYSSGCSNVTGMFSQDTDIFQLPRLHVQNWDGEEFSRQLSYWLQT